MREICQSGSMSGNRKQNQAKPDCGGAAKAKPIIHRETTVTAPVLDSTPRYYYVVQHCRPHQIAGWGVTNDFDAASTSIGELALPA